MMQTDMMGYGARPRGFEALRRALSRLNYPGKGGMGYPMAAIGPSAGMTPGWTPMMAPVGKGMQGMAGMAGKQGMMGFSGQPVFWFAVEGQPPIVIGPDQQ